MNQNNKVAIFNFLNTGMSLSFLNVILMAFFDQEPIYKNLVYLSLLLWFLSITLWISGMITLKKKGNPSVKGNYMSTSRLVDSGIFAFIRHPQYTAYILFNLGIILKAQNLAVLVAGMLAIIFLLIGMKEENKIMINKFGDAYRNYMKKVPF